MRPKKDLRQMSDAEPHYTILEAQQLLREREEHRRRREEMTRQLRVIGEYLNTNEYVNCGSCRRCKSSSEKPHGPYAYLYYRSNRTTSGYTSKYVPGDQVEAEQKRLAEKREAAEREIEALEGEQRE